MDEADYAKGVKGASWDAPATLGGGEAAPMDSESARVYRFRKRYDLSARVWKDLGEQQRKIFDIVREGVALGRDFKTVEKDLLTFVNFPDGGARVMASWRGMFPNTPEGRRKALALEYKKINFPRQAPGQLILKREDIAKMEAYIKSKIDGPMPEAVKSHNTRLGKGGIDYRVMRSMRTEQAAMLADEQTDFAGKSIAATGQVRFVLARGRDYWNCGCERAAQGHSPDCKKGVYYLNDPERPEIPVHPNCGCQWEPVLKTQIKLWRNIMSPPELNI